ncbi:hypothetical protein WA026_007714 [Henosepilachna vigintioctopunctata]|uniref:Uncharacterized protein n=1 Tax=Henosepilachna vigintioctopunctata TaxID=420089 RepID=A0AAW1U3V5_9CUCU
MKNEIIKSSNVITKKLDLSLYHTSIGGRCTRRDLIATKDRPVLGSQKLSSVSSDRGIQQTDFYRLNFRRQKVDFVALDHARAIRRNAKYSFFATLNCNCDEDLIAGAEVFLAI